MREEVIQDIEVLLGFKPDTTEFTEVEGGFTGAQKFIVSNNETNGTSNEAFIKLAELATHPEEAVVLDTEATMYGLISKLDGVGKYFPGYRAYKRDNQIAVLAIQYLPGLTWGGPWTEKTVNLLASALEEVHSVTIDPAVGQEITKHANALRTKLYEQSPYTFNRQKRRELFEDAADFDTGKLTNSRQHNYYHLPIETARDIAKSASEFNPEAEKKFIVTDLNFGNIGFSSDQVYFVDPVYVELGVPATDMVNVGINIVRTLPQTEDNARLAKLVKETFLSDKAALADTITYWVACTSLGYRGEKDEWMNFQQECALTALKVWEELNGDDS
jgi:hypothetical protein